MAKLKFPSDLKYARSDEWVRVEGDIVTMGISDYAQDALNDIVYVDLPSVGQKFSKGDSFGSVESVKAVSDVYAQVSGIVFAVNDELSSNSELVNSDPYGEGWLVKFKIEGAGDFADLLDASAYEEYCQNR
ncbi:MAG: glycine cleavage system protein GcvH [Anaerolineae bacterium]|jgi:glycine cleavage system H protein|nr:glycine cleavage system protein GcvH [Anaerolineae bacterium]